jgi:predicted Fe-S protein YdhL (DUF1289 family)
MTLSIMRPCKGCGRTFSARRSWQAYCSTECKLRWNRAFGKAALRRQAERREKAKK